MIPITTVRGPLVRLETFIRDAFIKKEHVVAVFFDLEKAYDTTWRYGILKDIHKLELRGRLPTFIEKLPCRPHHASPSWLLSV